MFELEQKYFGLVAGVDEAGRGPLVGPVVAASVIIDQTRIINGIKDSKKLTSSRSSMALSSCCAKGKETIKRL